jgi:HAD superfamily hydrolase (TIGR01509 family)
MKEIKNKFKAIIFDMDGTVLDTSNIWNNIFIEAFKQYGIPNIIDDNIHEVTKLDGMGLVEVVRLIKKKFTIALSHQQILDITIKTANILFQKNINFIKGFENFHQELQKNLIPCGIATNAHPASLDCIVKNSNLDKKFGNNIFCIGHVNFVPKPSPDLFLYTAQRLGAKPEECIVFEDSVHGFKAAKAASIPCIAIKNERNKDFLNLASFAIEDYSQAIVTLKKLITRTSST